MVHLSLLVGQLTCTETGSFVHHNRRFHFKIACLGVDVQEIVDESPLQPGSLAFVNRETGTGELHSKVEVDDVELLGEFPVRKGIRSEIRDFIAHLHDHVVFGGLSCRHCIARQVRKQHEQRQGLLLGFLAPGIEFCRF